MLPQNNNFLMDELNDFIHIYENALESNICDILISIFDQTSDKHERFENEGKPNFTQFNLTENKEITSEVNQIHNHVIKNVFTYRDKYYEFVDTRVFPKDHAFEQFRIKKYNPGGEDRFDTHVDVLDYSSSRRFLSFMWYLNDVETGGETVFKDLTIQPKKGTLLIFPPLWLFPHKGNSPISESKYIMSTYLHYK
jgi:prolyl 4-hydroxylase